MVKKASSLTVILVLIAIHLHGADTLLIHLTYKHIINNSGQTNGYKVIKQEFYTADMQLFREISFNESDGQISGYVFLFYRDDRLFTREYHKANDSLDYILKYEYDDKGNQTAVIRLEQGRDSKLVVTEKSVKVFGPGRNIFSEKKFEGNKLASVTTYNYDKSLLLVREKSNYKSPANTGMKNEVKEYSYGSAGKVTGIRISGKDEEGRGFASQEDFEYNDKGLLSVVKYNGNNGVLKSQKVYTYLDSGALSKYEEFDSHGIKTLLLQYDYKKHYMEKGTQVSCYENL
jgi:hypothetical protein